MNKINLSNKKEIKNQSKLWDRQYSLHKTLWHFQTENISDKIKGKNVLELGVGDGKTLRAILRKRPKKVIAIDFSQEAIKKCKAQFKENNLHFANANITKLPFEDSKFDVIFCYYVLNNLPGTDRRKSIAEIHRVLRKKGVLFFEDFSAGDFREETGKKIENHTVKKKNGIICHFFKINEINALFSKFSKKELKLRVTKPITHKNNLIRKTISGVILK